MEKKFFSLNDVRLSYVQKKEWERQFPVSYYIFRPLSFPLTVVFLRFTADPARVAWLGFLLGLAGNITFLFAYKLGMWPSIVLLLLFSLLDAVDGNIARTTQSVTYGGKFLDGTLGATVEGSYGFFLGIGLYWANNPFPIPVLSPFEERSLYLILGAVMTICWYYSGLVDESFSKFQVLKSPPSSDITAPIQSSTFRRWFLYRLFINLHSVNVQLLLLAVCTALQLVQFFMILFGCYYFLRALAFSSFLLYRSRTVLS